MRRRYLAAVFTLLAMLAMCLPATAQSIEETRAARDKAKADLIRAQEAFDRADEAYIKALGGAASKAAAAAAVPTPAAEPAVPATRAIKDAASVVTFTLSGVGALEGNPLDYRARLIIDEQPAEWTQHASGVKIMVPPGTRSLAYEVQNNSNGEATRPAWKTICQGTLALKPAIRVDIAIAQKATCTVS